MLTTFSLYFRMACTTVAVDHLDKLLPENFKTPLTEKQMKLFEYEFHSADYHLLDEIVNGLKNAVGYIITELKEQPENSTNNTEDLTVAAFLKRSCDKDDDENLLKMIGIKKLKPSQVLCLSELQLVSCFSCLKLFSEWIDDGSYDFRTIPLSFKKHMSPEDALLLESICDNWTGSKIKLMNELDQFIEILKHSEHNIIQRNKDNSSVSNYICNYKYRVHCKDIIAIDK